MRRSLNIPLLVGTVVALLVFLPGIYFWRLKQVESGADVYLERAESLAKEEQWAQSADYLFLYLRLRPDDIAARIQLAETYDRLASQSTQLSRAVDLYYQALAKASDDQQRPLRLRLAELLIQTEQFAAALTEADKLTEVGKDDPAVSRIRALALYGAARGGGLDAEMASPSEVGQALEDACRLNPADVTLVATLVDVLRRQPDLLSQKASELTDADRSAMADELLDTLVLSAPQEASAYLARYQDRIGRENDSDKSLAEEDLAQALKLAPENAVVLLAAASHERQRGEQGDSQDRAKHLEAASEYYARALRAAPTLDRAYVGLGDTQRLQGNPQGALKTWELGLEKCGQDNIVLNAMLADELISQQELERADQCISRLKATANSLRQRGFLEAQLVFDRGTDLLKARLEMAKGNPEKAIEILREVGGGRRGDTGEGLITFQALMMLGGIYATQNQVDMALSAYEDAGAARPSSIEPHLAMANLLLQNSRPSEAAASLQKAAALDNSVANQVLLVGANLRALLSLPPAERNWRSFDQQLATAKQNATNDGGNELWRLGILEAESEFHRNAAATDQKSANQAAVQSLRAVAKRNDLSVEALAGLAEALERFGSADDADRLLARLRKEFPNDLRSYLVAAGTSANRREYEQARETLVAGLEAVDQAQRLTLRQALVGLDIQSGRTEEGWQALSELQRENPDNRELLEQLLELSIEQGKFVDAERLEKSYREHAGVSEVSWQLMRVRRLLASASGSSDPGLTEAEKLLAGIRAQQPNTPQTYLLEGELKERAGKADQAVAAYQQAIQLGERRLAVYERLILLLYQLDRFSEADQYLTSLQELSPASTGLSTLDISGAMRTGRMDHALESARRGVAQRPSDPLAYVWLGQILLASNNTKEAEQALQKAIELGPTDPRAQGAMLNFLVRTRQSDRARTLLVDFAEKLEITPVERELLLAAGFEVLGDREKVISHLKKAESLDPDDVRVHERMGIALLDQDGEQAEKSLRRALELDSAADGARRALAGLLTDRGGEENWQAALALLNETNASGAPTLPNLRLQAMVLARRGGAENLAKARSIMERLAAETAKSTRYDRFLLAQLTEAEGNSDLAGRQFLELASETAPLPAHLVAYVDWLLRHEDSKEAGLWLEKLEQLDPASIATVALRARWLLAEGRGSQIEPLVEKAAERLLRANLTDGGPGDEQKLETCLTIGDLYFTVKQYAAAERWYRRAYGLDAKQYGRLARCVAELDRLAEAIDLCALAAKSDSSHVPAATLAEILVLTRHSKADAAQAEPLLAAALAQHGDQAELLLPVANFKVVQQQLDSAADLYRRVIALEPRNVGALNNLAAILADRPDGAEEAIEYLNRAIELVGAQPNLLDTKGTILLGLNKVDEAIPLLRAAASSPDPDPRFLFHLAFGLYRTGDLANARNALERARKGDLERTVLTSTDHKMLAELDAQLR